MATGKKDERVDKRRVTMRNRQVVDTKGGTLVLEYGPDDYVRPDLLDDYVADARTRWEVVTVSDEPDAGPAGYGGATTDHANRRYFPASGCKDCDHAPEGYTTVLEG